MNFDESLSRFNRTVITFIGENLNRVLIEEGRAINLFSQREVEHGIEVAHAFCSLGFVTVLVRHLAIPFLDVVSCDAGDGLV